MFEKNAKIVFLGLKKTKRNVNLRLFLLKKYLISKIRLELRASFYNLGQNSIQHPKALQGRKQSNNKTPHSQFS